MADFSDLSDEVLAALPQPMQALVEDLSAQIKECNERMKAITAEEGLLGTGDSENLCSLMLCHVHPLLELVSDTKDVVADVNKALEEMKFESKEELMLKGVLEQTKIYLSQSVPQLEEAWKYKDRTRVRKRRFYCVTGTVGLLTVFIILCLLYMFFKLTYVVYRL
jgi:hypothetical protein